MARQHGCQAKPLLHLAQHQQATIGGKPFRTERRNDGLVRNG